MNQHQLHSSQDASHRSSAGNSQPSLNHLAAAATTHCMTGCAIGEVLGMVISTAAGWGNSASIAISIVLSFVFGYSLTMLPLLRTGMPVKTATGLALASDSASITVMEIVDNAIMLFVPGAMSATLDSGIFWGSLALSMAIAWVAAFPVNRWLISKGLGHAKVHAHHH